MTCLIFVDNTLLFLMPLLFRHQVMPRGNPGEEHVIDCCPQSPLYDSSIRTVDLVTTLRVSVNNSQHFGL